MFDSLGSRPLRKRRDWATLVCNDENLSLAPSSWSIAKLTPPLQRLQTPSNRMIGLVSSLKTSLATAFQSQSTISSLARLFAFVFGDSDDDEVDAANSDDMFGLATESRERRLCVLMILLFDQALVVDRDARMQAQKNMERREVLAFMFRFSWS